MEMSGPWTQTWPPAAVQAWTSPRPQWQADHPYNLNPHSHNSSDLPLSPAHKPLASLSLPFPYHGSLPTQGKCPGASVVDLEVTLRHSPLSCHSSTLILTSAVMVVVCAPFFCWDDLWLFPFNLTQNSVDCTISFKCKI